eukprot:360202-Chlamydomonas_euryale.AAC.12
MASSDDATDCASEPCCPFDALPREVLLEVLAWVGAWAPPESTLACPWSAAEKLSAMNVCTAWRDALRGSPGAMARLLLNTSTSEQHHSSCIVRASRAGKADILAAMLAHAAVGVLPQQAHAAAADKGLLAACVRGHAPCVRALLQAPGHAARADCDDSKALLYAAQAGHADVVDLLLGAPRHAARADCHHSEALRCASLHGHAEVVRLLLRAPCHAAHADGRDGEALLHAACSGHAEVVKLLLGARLHAVRADCRGGEVLVCAAGCGHAAVVEALLSAPEHPAQADCNDCEALVRAARCAFVRQEHLDCMCSLHRFACQM